MIRLGKSKEYGEESCHTLFLRTSGDHARMDLNHPAIFSRLSLSTSMEVA
jgi:hypothetical protein